MLHSHLRPGSLFQPFTGTVAFIIFHSASNVNLHPKGIAKPVPKKQFKSKVDTLLRLYALLKRVLDFFHFGNQISGFDEFWLCISSR